MKFWKWKAKKIHGILEAGIFFVIFLSSFLLVLRTSMQSESVSRLATCSKAAKKGIIGIYTTEERSDMTSFARGNENFVRRTFEHFLKPRGPENFVFAGPLFSVAMSFLVLGGRGGQDEASLEIMKALELPCEYNHLQQDLDRILRNKANGMNVEAFVFHDHDPDSFLNTTTSAMVHVSRYADKFTDRLAEQKSETTIETYFDLVTSYGESKFAMNTVLNLNSPDRSNRNNFINNNVTVYSVEELKSRVVVIQDQFLFFLPFTKLAFKILEQKIGVFEMNSLNHTVGKIIYEGPARLNFPTEIKTIQSVLKMAIPLQQFNAFAIFDGARDFPKQSLKCAETLRMRNIWQNARFNLMDVLRTDFDVGGDPPEAGGKPPEIFNIEPPFLFYMLTSDEPKLIQVFGRVGQ